jgi:hypothetical protein
MKTSILLLLLLPTTILAKQIELDLNYSLMKDGVNIESSTRVKASLGRSWKIPLEGLPNRYIKMTASESPTKEIKLSSEIFELTNGKEKILSRPIVSVELGKEANIESGSIDGSEHFKLSVTPIKIR